MLGHEVSELQEYPSRMKFRKILKILAEEFPTRRYKDSSLFEDSQVLQAVRKAIATVDE
jgi:hypothetical protein